MGADPRLMDLPVPILLERIAGGAMRAGDLAAAAAGRAEASATTGLAWFDGDYVRRQGAAMDMWRARGRPLGPLHGLPVVVSDLVDTARIPTAHGFGPEKDRVPAADAAPFERLRNAGIVCVGKGETTPFGVLGAGGASLPVRARCAPVSLAFCADGSAIAEAAAGGVVGYRPSAGSVPMRGVFAASPTLTAPTVLTTDLFAPDEETPYAMPSPSPGLRTATLTPPLMTPTLAFVPPPWWDGAEDDVREAFAELTGTLDDRAFTAPLPDIFGEAPVQARRIIAAETARALHGTVARHGDSVPGAVAAVVEAGERVGAREYLTARDWRTVLAAGLGSIFDRCDAILTGVSPAVGAAGPQDANILTAFLGLPSVTLPLLDTEDGRAIGLQLVGRKGEDARLLRTAAWLQTFVLGQGDNC